MNRVGRFPLAPERINRVKKHALPLSIVVPRGMKTDLKKLSERNVEFVLANPHRQSAPNQKLWCRPAKLIDLGRQ
jgi:hypothetical protein